MVTKGRKLIALLLMAALVVTYTFGANLTAFAEEGQGDANPKANTSESAELASPSGVSEGEAVVEESSKETVVEEDAALVKATPPIQHGTVHLTYGESYSSFTPDSSMHLHQGDVEHWSVSSESSATDCYAWNEMSHKVTNTNTTESTQTISVVHTINKAGNQGSSKSEVWNVALAPAPTVTVYYHKNDGQGYGTTVHTETVVWGANSSMWGIPTRDGWTFTHWTIGHGGRHYSPGDDFIPSEHADKHNEVHILAHWTKMTLGPVHGKSDSVIYDGKEHAVYGIIENAAITTGFAEFDRNSTGGHHAVTTIYYVKADEIFAKGTEVGEYNTEAEYALVYSWSTTQHGGDPSPTGMYVQVVPGTLIIEDNTFEGQVTGKSDSIEYDGEEHTLYGIEETITIDGPYAIFKSIGSPQYGSKFAVLQEDIYSQGKNVGKYNTVVDKALVYTKANVPGNTWHSTGKYVTVVPGTLEITPVDATVYVELSHESIPYDGELHTYVAEFSFSTDCELLEKAGYTPAYAGNKHDYWCKRQEVGKTETVVKSNAELYTLGLDEEMAKNFNVTFEVTQGWLEITPEIVEVIFKLNGGTLNGGTDDVVIEAEVGETINAPEAPTKKGYEFQYWKGSRLDAGEEYVVPSGGHTFAALYTATGGDSDDDENVKTADTFGLVGILALLASSILGLLVLSAARRREE